MLGALILLLLMVWGIYYLSRPPKNEEVNYFNTSAALPAASVDDDWRDYIASFEATAKTKAEKELIKRMLAGGPQASPGFSSWQYQEPAAAVESGAAATPSTASAAVATMPSVSVEAEPSTPIDNALLLLYFGAFLFVASVGLFVVFGDFDGLLRTILVGIVTAVMYFGGLSLYSRVERLKQAGISFVAIGMASAPLTGLAMYTYLFDRSNGPAVWFATSIVCAAMYANALIRLRSVLLGYLFIFSFLSLFEASISLIDLPLYYFIWGMIVAGMLLKLLGNTKWGVAELREPSAASSQLIIPLTLLVSLAVVPAQGSWQLAISLLLGAFFYAQEAYGDAAARRLYTQTAHILLIGAIITGAFSLRREAGDVIYAGLAIGLVQTAVLAFYNKLDDYIKDAGLIALIAVIVPVLLSLNRDFELLSSLGLALAMALVITIRQKSLGALYCGAIIIALLPLVIGQIVLYPRFNGLWQAVASLIAVLVLLVTRIGLMRSQSYATWRHAVDEVMIGAASIAMFSAFFGSDLTVLLIAGAVAAIFVVIGLLEKTTSWIAQAGFIISLPILKTMETPDDLVFLGAMMLSLLANIAIALRYRFEANRWLGSVVWLAMPIAIGSGGLGSDFSAAGFSGLYLGVMAGFILARLIARGVFLKSFKVPILSYAKTASSVYALGYTVAGGLAFFISLSAANSQFVTSIVLGVLIAATLYISYVVERSKDLLALIPFFVQALLLSSIRPSVDSGLLTVFMLTSLAAAAAMYGLTFGKEAYAAIRKSALLTSFTAPASILFAPSELVMPLTLMAAGSLTLVEARRSSQGNRELSGGIIVAAIFWLMYYFGIRNFQAYTHVLALVFAGYAYWRHYRNDTPGCDQYLQVMFATATIPLLLQALAAQSGGLYGWWLLLEQVGFMILGMMLGRRYLTMWSLYVAVGAVLYQLRNLGYAALAVLALFIIGLAIYYLTRENKDKS